MGVEHRAGVLRQAVDRRVEGLLRTAVASMGSSAHALDVTEGLDETEAARIEAAREAIAKASLDAKKYQDAITKLKEIQGLSGKNDYDEHLINEIKAAAHRV